MLTRCCVSCLQSSQYKTVERLVQTLKNLCCALDEVETQDITEAVKRLRHSVNLPRTHSPKVGSDPAHRNARTHTHALTAARHVTFCLCRWTPDRLLSPLTVSAVGRPPVLHAHYRGDVHLCDPDLTSNRSRQSGGGERGAADPGRLPAGPALPPLLLPPIAFLYSASSAACRGRCGGEEQQRSFWYHGPPPVHAVCSAWHPVQLGQQVSVLLTCRRTW